MKEESGFTIMEMMVVIGIVAIMSAFAVPAFLGRMPAKRMESAASGVNAAFQVARLSAIKENTCAVIAFSPSNDNYRIFADDGDGTPGKPAIKPRMQAEPTVKTEEFPAGVELISSAPGAAPFCLTAGAFPTAPVTISLKNASDTTWTVTLNITGSSRINRG